LFHLTETSRRKFIENFLSSTTLQTRMHWPGNDTQQSQSRENERDHALGSHALKN
jgi:hypothetical protein